MGQQGRGLGTKTDDLGSIPDDSTKLPSHLHMHVLACKQTHIIKKTLKNKKIKERERKREKEQKPRAASLKELIQVIYL